MKDEAAHERGMIGSERERQGGLLARRGWFDRTP
jgi:hypothetical protein